MAGRVQGRDSRTNASISNRIGATAVVSKVGNLLLLFPSHFTLFFVANLCMKVLAGQIASTAPTASATTLWIATLRWLKLHNRALVVAARRSR